MVLVRSFFSFGLLQGVYLVINHAWRYLTPRGSRFHDVVPAPFLVLLTFVSFLVSLVFFRASNVHEAVYILGSMSGFHGLGNAYASNPGVADLPTIAFFLKKLSGCLMSLAVLFPNYLGISKYPGDSQTSFRKITRGTPV